MTSNPPRRVPGWLVLLALIAAVGALTFVIWNGPRL